MASPMVTGSERELLAPVAGPAVASVLVDLPLAHLDRPFDYAVPADLAESAVPGARVRVRVAGQDLAGFVVERRSETSYPGKLQPLRRVLSAEPVLSPEIAELAGRVAAHYAGTTADVLRLAVPPRVAKVEAESSPGTVAHPAGPDPGPWARYPAGEDYLAAVAEGRPARAVWTVLPGTDWPAALAAVAQASLSAGRGALLVVPDMRDVDRVDAALTDALGPGRHVALTAALGPTERYRRWLAVRRGAVRVVVGTRAAMFAPVADLGVAVVWDDGDDLHAELRAPYPHVREVLALRAVQTGSALLVAGYARTAEAERSLQSGWALPIVAPREAVRTAAPRITALGDDAELARDAAAASARLSSVAWQTAKDGLTRGPVLVQVPRAGYLPGMACRDCRSPARCPTCAGPLQSSATGTTGAGWLACGWCAEPAPRWVCPHCSGRALRAVVVGVRRTAEELGRAFPGARVVVSAGESVLATVGPGPSLVLATPGAEPVAPDGYAAALLLDGWALLSRIDLRAGEEALRRWLTAAALVRSAADGGRVVVAAENSAPTVQALLRWDPVGYAARELAERSELRFPPAARMAVLEGSRGGVEEMLAAAALPPSAQVLGPVPLPDGRARAIVRTPPADGSALSTALRAGQALRSARKSAETVRVQIDPMALA